MNLRSGIDFDARCPSSDYDGDIEYAEKKLVVISSGDSTSTTEDSGVESPTTSVGSSKSKDSSSEQDGDATRSTKLPKIDEAEDQVSKTEEADDGEGKIPDVVNTKPSPANDASPKKGPMVLKTSPKSTLSNDTKSTTNASIVVTAKKKKAITKPTMRNAFLKYAYSVFPFHPGNYWHGRRVAGKKRSAAGTTSNDANDDEVAAPSAKRQKTSHS
eukprot:CAMPEP_0194031030 /NCGR_PEP_ID=MMETSP0009_2-20130614/4309_1 /TAXON_ID=210454 /ORGANISM="Grammatophora oceanica, Strain CCMP 410" /LENGTH=214 /DNA_ID=CAMNT_0038671085 /DNA_START=96 /DNA_END=740 /DNA_ORIENTATION=-